MLNICLRICLLSSSPLVLVLFLVLLTLVTRLLVGIRVSRWLIYALILLYVGGVIVLFIYMTTLIYTKKVTLRFYSLLPIRGFTGLNIMVSNITDEKLGTFSLGILYDARRLSVLGFLGGYLLRVLVVVTKLVIRWEGGIKILFHEKKIN